MEKSITAFIIVWIFFIAISVLLASFLFMFNRKNKNRKYKKIYINKALITINISILVLSIIPLSLGIVSSIHDWSKTINILLLILGLACLLTVTSIMFFMLQYIAIGITDDNVEFLGEKIQLNKIYKLDNNDKNTKYCINYYEGKRGQKKYSFNLKSSAYAFIKENENFLQEKMLIQSDEIKNNTKLEEINTSEIEKK